MAARPVSESRPAFSNWDDWLPDNCPDVSGFSLWSEFEPPWEQRVVGRVADVARTNAFHLLDRPVRTGEGQKTYKGVYGGAPFQRLDTQRALVNTRVYEAKTPPSWTRGLFPTTVVPLPDRDRGGEWVRRFGDPTVTGTDAQSFFIDSATKRYYELSAFGPSAWPFSVLVAPWRADNVSVWDLTRDWRYQRVGTTAAKIPLLPMLPRIEEYEAGGIPHALHFVACGYAKDEFVSPARGTDGDVVGHPLRCGARLRLTEDAFYSLMPMAKTQHDRVFLTCAREFGFICTDRTTDDPLVGDSIRQPQDPRLNLTVTMRRRHLEILL